ncbi:MAG: hypothetical protein IJY28_03920 [Clostridia bacterium]|nr:hypothetical protein [Clostridia bacterium]
MNRLKKCVKHVLLGIALYLLVMLLLTLWGEIDGGVHFDWDAVTAQLTQFGLFLGLYRIVDLLEDENEE